MYPICNHGGYEILSTKEECGEESVEVAMNNGEKRIGYGYKKVKYTTAGRAYFYMFGLRYYLDNFIRV